MDENATVSMTFTDGEIERILMGLTLARNSPQMTGRYDIDDLIAKFKAHADETDVTAPPDRATDPFDADN